MILGDDGERIEKVASKKSNLEWLRITKADREDFSGAQMALIGDPTLYRLFEQGQDILAVPDLQRARAQGVRVFRGPLKLDQKSPITEMQGITLPEGNERFPRFVSRRAKSLDTSSPLKL